MKNYLEKYDKGSKTSKLKKQVTKDISQSQEQKGTAGTLNITPYFTPIGFNTYAARKAAELNIPRSQIIAGISKGEYLPQTKDAWDVYRYDPEKKIFYENQPWIQGTDEDFKAFEVAGSPFRKYRRTAVGVLPPNLMDKKKKGGKMTKDYISEARKKPGGSNVGKKKFSDGEKRKGPYVGQKGGAPKGSYPIPDMKRAKAALKLAHNAPNPEAIKKAVYKKFPSLKEYGGKMKYGGGNKMKYEKGGKLDISNILAKWQK